MLRRLRVPKTIQWLVSLFFIYLIIFTGFRIATVIFFKPADIKLSSLFYSFWVGLKYDLRWISIILLPIALLSIVPRLTPFYSANTKRFWTIYLGMITLLVLFFYGADFGQFAYVNARLNADALIFAEDPKESLKMVWQSYPVVWILLGIFGAVLMMVWMFRKTLVDIEFRNMSIHKFDYRRRWLIAGIAILIWFIYGFFTIKPLNFNRAFSLNDEFKSNLALNPLQNFFTTLRFRKPDENARPKPYYKDIKSFLGINTEPNSGNPYYRLVEPKNSLGIESQPNVVLVICESFSMYKSSMSGNSLDATPYFNQMTKEGIFFNRCFSPSFGTARGVFSILSGVPDVQLGKFSSRNEESVVQRTIINDFIGYDKFYFLGGRSQFNNFNGLIKNINDVKIFEEGSYKSPIVNVWGISDKNLFLEANERLSKNKNPFFAIIQTADNHRPFLIPEEDLSFFNKNYSPEQLKANGFESLEEYRAFCYTDYTIKTFIEAAKKEPYFNNTVFVFIGDHGVEGNTGNLYPKAWMQQRLSDEHIPFLIYAPGFVTPQLRTETVSQIDVLPTIAGLIHSQYQNTSLGRDLLDEEKTNDAAFIMNHAAGWIGMINDQYYFRKNIRMPLDEMVPVQKDTIAISAQKRDSIKQSMSRMTSAFYETSKWMLVNNK